MRSRLELMNHKFLSVKYKRPISQSVSSLAIATLEPDVYSGPNCDEHRPRWIASYPKHGDEELSGDVVLDATLYPPGTQVIIQSPVCPKCHEIYENCNLEPEIKHLRTCDFDWKLWVEEQYS